MVLGGSGFVGRHVVARLEALGSRVTVIARHLDRTRTHGALALEIGSASATAFAKALAGLAPDAVVNATGSIWRTSPEKAWEAVAVPSLLAVEAVYALPHPARYVHLGSVLEVGGVPFGTTIGPDTPSREPDAYGAAKRAVSERVLAASRDGGLDAMVLRIANVSGPGSPDTSLLGRVALELARDCTGGGAVERDPLTAYRDFVDVRDVADAVALAVVSSCRGQLVDIGRGEARSVRDLVRLMIEVSGVPKRLVERDGSQAHSKESWTQVDIGPAARLLGWTPSRDLRRSLLDHYNEVLTRTRGAA